MFINGDYTELKVPPLKFVHLIRLVNYLITYSNKRSLAVKFC